MDKDKDKYLKYKNKYLLLKYGGIGAAPILMAHANQNRQNQERRRKEELKRQKEKEEIQEKEKKEEKESSIARCKEEEKINPDKCDDDEILIKYYNDLIKYEKTIENYKKNYQYTLEKYNNKLKEYQDYINKKKDYESKLDTYKNCKDKNKMLYYFKCNKPKDFIDENLSEPTKPIEPTSENLKNDFEKYGPKHP